MSRLSIAVCGLSALAIAAAGIPAAAAPSDALSGQTLTNSVGGVPSDAGSAQDLGNTDFTGSLLPASELGGATSGVPLTEGADPAQWNLKQGLGGPLVMAADIALKSKGYQGGLAGQGVDPNQITGPLSFEGVMPSTSNLMPTAATSHLPDAASHVTSLLGLGGGN